MSSSYSRANTAVDAMNTTNAAMFGGDVSVGPHNNGKLGVGTLTPDRTLDISGSDSTGQVVRITSPVNADNNPQLLIDGNTSAGSPYVGTLVELKTNTDYRGRGVHLTVGDVMMNGLLVFHIKAVDIKLDIQI